MAELRYLLSFHTAQALVFFLIFTIAFILLSGMFVINKPYSYLA